MYRRSNHKCSYSKRLGFDTEPEQPRSICLMGVSIAVDYIMQFALCMQHILPSICSSELHYTIELLLW